MKIILNCILDLLLGGCPEKSIASPAIPAAMFDAQANFEKWLEHFYKECGREVTLAYTTLNQMKNWAMVIVAAMISALVALAKPSDGKIAPEVHVAMFAAAVIAYAFNLRFFVRAIICYINLTRWNIIQNRILAYQLGPYSGGAEAVSEKREENRIALLKDVRELYQQWLSPITRSMQVHHNLKLGFGLVLALPIIFVVLWGIQFWGNPLVRGFAAFAIGSTIVEFSDFLNSRVFDTPKRAGSRGKVGSGYFPVPTSSGWYLGLWVLNVVVSICVAKWDIVKVWVLDVIK